jgi:hypothetical protein
MSEIDETLATYIWNTCKTPEKNKNMCVAIAKYMQHPDETLATYV